MATWTSSTARSIAPRRTAFSPGASTSSRRCEATSPTCSARCANRSTRRAPTLATSSRTRRSRQIARPGGLKMRSFSIARAVALGGALFVASGALGGPPDINFAPAAIRTDNAVKATVAKAIGAGDFVGLGVGVYLAIAGFAVSAAGAILARPARDERVWRTQDYVLL